MKLKGKKKTEKALGEGHFQALIENAHDGIVVYDTSGRIKFASKSVKRILGYGSGELLGKLGGKFIHPADVKETRKSFFSLLKTPRKTITLFQRLRHKNGTYIWAEALLTNFNHIPEIKGIVSNFRDITEKKIAEEKNRETQQLLESINQNLSEGIFMGVLDGPFLYANEAFLKITGQTQRMALSRKLSDIFLDKKMVPGMIKQLKASFTVRDVETRFRRKTGDSFLGIMNISLLKNNGRASHFVGSIRDITNEKKAIREKIESEVFLDNIINTVAAPLFVKDSRHRWVLVNQEFCKLIGQPKEMLLGKSDVDFWPAHEARVFIKVDNEVIRTGRTIINEEKIKSENGTTRDLLTVKSLYKSDSGKKFIIGFITEITAVKKAQERINQLHANLQAVMESANESIFAVDKKLNYLAFNKHHQTVMKQFYDADIAIGANKIQYLKDSKDAGWVKSELKKALKGSQFYSEHALEYPQRNGYIQTTYNPIRDDHNEVKGVAVFVRDITKSKQIQDTLRDLNNELTTQNLQLAAQEDVLKNLLNELSERNFELDQLMYKTSHDLRAPLCSVLGLLNLANLDTDPENQKLYLEKIKDRINKLDDFINSMLNYARVNRAELDMTPINLEEVALNSIRELEYLENFKSVKLQLNVSGHATDFFLDKLRINIIFSNIISNAFKYYNPNAKSFLNITIQITEKNATIEFADNGIGIKAEHMDKIFNMFYRATERSQGSGLGMYIVKQAVERLNGTISLQSNFGIGTTIKIILPNGKQKI